MTSHPVPDGGTGSEPAPPGGDRRPRPRTGPLAGLRVADFCWMGVGSIATRLLADFGADVIKIENRRRLDTPRRLPIYKDAPARAYGEEDTDPDPERGGLHNNYSRNKLGVTIDMRSPRGKALAERLIASSSVVTENFAPGVMERWGLTMDRLRELRSDVIFARMSGFGHSGPDAEYRSYGPIVQAVSGLSFISGLPDTIPSGWGLSYMDNQAAYYNSIGLLMSILHRLQTGEGGEIDVAAVEAGIALLGPVLLDVTVNDRVTRGSGFPTGNRLEHPAAAPHGVYRARGDDRWVAIAVMDDEDWRRLGKVVTEPWTTEDRFARAEDRVRFHDELDGLVEAWTRHRDPHEVMALLQGAGVPAAAVQNAQDLSENDPQIAHRGLFFELDHPVIGPATFEGVPIAFSGMAPDHWRSAPLLGEDNAYVFKELLGLSADEYDDLVVEGVV